MKRVSVITAIYLAMWTHATPLHAQLNDLGGVIGGLLGAPSPSGPPSITGGTASAIGIDVLSPNNNSGLIDGDILTSDPKLLGLGLDETTVNGNDILPIGDGTVSNPANDFTTMLQTGLLSLAGPEGSATTTLEGLGDELQSGTAQLTDTLADAGLGDSDLTGDTASVSVGTLDIGTNSADTLIDADVLTTDTDSGGAIGLGVITDGPAGNGDVAGISVIGGDGAGRGDALGASVIGGNNAGSSDGVGASIIGGDGAGSGTLAGAAVLSGNDSGTAEQVGAAVIAGDNSGDGDTLAGAGVLTGRNSGTGGLAGVSALGGSGSGEGDLLGADILGTEGTSLTVASLGVDTRGASCGDADGDGVCDKIDLCADTPAGAGVMGNGCHLAEDRPLVLDQVHFVFARADLHPSSFPELEKARDILLANPELNVEIAGHTDRIGGFIFNQGLSERRAAAVRDYLVERGIAAERLTIHGYGFTRPIAPETTLEGADNPYARQLNRRVEFRVISRASRPNATGDA